jgi:hypothetical protein
MSLNCKIILDFAMPVCGIDIFANFWPGPGPGMHRRSRAASTSSARARPEIRTQRLGQPGPGGSEGPGSWVGRGGAAGAAGPALPAIVGCSRCVPARRLPGRHAAAGGRVTGLDPAEAGSRCRARQTVSRNHQRGFQVTALT